MDLARLTFARVARGDSIWFGFATDSGCSTGGCIALRLRPFCLVFGLSGSVRSCMAVSYTAVLEVLDGLSWYSFITTIIAMTDGYFPAV